MLIIRLLYHAWASYKIYGVVAALLSIPRTVCSNIINFHALLRAYRGFFSTPQKEAKWDKTNNTFPSKAILKKYTKKLGDLLLENKIITTEQLREALLLQKTSHDKLGKILISKYAIRPEQIALMLGKQFNIEVVDHNKFPTLTHQEINFMTIENYNWLIKNQIYPVSFFENSIILALINPANEHNNDEAILRLKPYKVKFVLLSDTV